MPLIKSISGIRGTIGGKPEESLSPIDIVKFTAAYGTIISNSSPENKTIVIGRDARLSGEMVYNLVANTLVGMGFDILNLGLSTTPTVEMAVTMEKAAGGIILTASHNPIHWNALKLLNDKGEFISGEVGEELLKIADRNEFVFEDVKKLGRITDNNDYLDKHIAAILELPNVNAKAIKAAGFSIAIDGVNSSGGIAVPAMLHALGVTDITKLHCEPTGNFAHNPEPIPENLTELSKLIEKGSFDLGIVVDPDVDRLAFVCEDGEMFGEEYTLVAVADYVLSKSKVTKPVTVSNLSSTRALKDVTEKHGGEYFASAVGEVNVVSKMKKTGALIGGEGNGGIILPELHYGRDALVGIALFLSQLAEYGKSIGMLRKQYPNYTIAKKKIELEKGVDVDAILTKMHTKYSKNDCDLTDGLKIHFDKEWVHLRKSNTEPIIRIYAESEFETTAKNLADKIIKDIIELMKG